MRGPCDGGCGRTIDWQSQFCDACDAENEIQMERESEIEEIANVCAESAVKAGGPRPVDVDGKCLLPLEPMPGDFEHLEKEIDCPTADEKVDFAGRYKEYIEDEKEERGWK